MVEWPYYGGDQANTHYTRLSRINKNNVRQLALAWEWKPREEKIASEYGVTPGRFEATPLMIDGVLYVVTPLYRVFALDADTGKELWSYDPRVYERTSRTSPSSPIGSFRHRGVASWTDGTTRRIFLNVRGQLIALDAKTGKPVPSFGTNGIADMTADLSHEYDKATFDSSSPPVVYGDVVISGNTVFDGFVSSDVTPGDIQAFDVRTGTRVWVFRTIPRKGEFGSETWKNDSFATTGHANVWQPITIDDKRGLVYLPATSPTNDYYGGNRKGNNLFADTLLCLDARTGKRVWYFQIVHHDLWDFDGTSTPTLLTIRVNGKNIDALAAPSKNGFLYVFDRVTGQPVWPIEERPVPQSDIPGEETSPTQPFPTRPPAFAQQGFTADDVVDFTPQIKAAALEKLKNYRTGPLFNPPSLPGATQGTLYRPTITGGANWGGASVDLAKGYLYVKTHNMVRAAVLMPRKPSDPPDPSIRDIPRPGVDEGPYKYNFPNDNVTVDGTMLINKPPYGSLTAYDLNRGTIMWQIAVGDMPTMRNHPLLKPLNLPPMGWVGNEGTLVTASGLIFVASADSRFFAFDSQTGKEIWVTALPYAMSSTPMTYRTRSGRQFIVIGEGGGTDSTLAAFALPDAARNSP